MKTKLLFISSMCAAGLLLSGCEAVNSGLSAVNEALDSVSGSSTSSSTGSAGSSAIRVPESTRQATLAAFVNAESANVQAMIDDAKPTIAEMVGKAACGASDSVMGRYTDPDSYTMSYVSPMINMRYHQSGCLTPIRIHSWERRASNALRFAVDYMSPQSEETTRRFYTAVKQPNGEWLFRW